MICLGCGPRKAVTIQRFRCATVVRCKPDGLETTLLRTHTPKLVYFCVSSGSRGLGHPGQQAYPQVLGRGQWHQRTWGRLCGWGAWMNAVPYTRWGTTLRICSCNSPNVPNREPSSRGIWNHPRVHAVQPLACGVPPCSSYARAGLATTMPPVPLAAPHSIRGGRLRQNGLGSSPDRRGWTAYEGAAVGG